MSNTLRYLKKYDQLESVSWAQSYRNKLPLICLPEMYYILAECRYHSSGDVVWQICRKQTFRLLKPCFWLSTVKKS